MPATTIRQIGGHFLTETTNTNAFICTATSDQIENQMVIRKAIITDAQKILALNRKNLFDEVSETQPKSGFVRIPLEKSALERIILSGYAVVCEINQRIVGYYILAGEGGNRHAAYLREIMIQYTDFKIEETLFGTQACIDRGYRNLGIGRRLFDFLLSLVPDHMKYMFGSITKGNMAGYDFSVTKMCGTVVFEDHDRYYVLFDLNKLVKNRCLFSNVH